MSLRKSISNTFTVTTLVDGESAPYYFEEKYAWSNDSSTQSVTTPPSISGGWQTSIPPSNGYAYLWRMSIRHVWNESTRSYTQEAAQYFRMSGTNGTSIHIKGHVSTVQNLPTTHVDGDAYVVDANGHLYMWSDESGSWVDIGVFQGEAGKTYYTHIAWASQVNYSGTTVTSVDGFITVKSPNDTTHMWMGVYIDEQSGQDESNALRYTWSYTKGDKGYDAVTYGFVFTEAFAKADASKTITGNIKGYAYKYVGDTRTPLADTIIRYGYIIDDSGTYAETTTNANGFFDAENWFNGDNIDNYAKGSPSIFAAIQIGGVIVHVEYITISLQGDTGGRGKTGRFYYYAQKWSDDSSVSYAVTDAEAPYFLYNNKYWVFNPTNNGTYTMSEMGAPSSKNENWKLMVTDFKFIITEAIFGSYAHFGSFIINGDWLLSTNGKVGESVVSGESNISGSVIGGSSFSVKAVTLFDSAYPSDGMVDIAYENNSVTIATSETTKQIMTVYLSASLTYRVSCDYSRSSGGSFYVRIRNASYGSATPIYLAYTSGSASGNFRVTTSGTYIVEIYTTSTGYTASVWNTSVSRLLFAPMYAVDGKTGKTYQNDAVIKGNIYRPALTINNSNYATYASKNSDDVYIIDLKKTGLNILLDFDLSSGGLLIDLPYSDEYIGAEVTIINNSNKSAYIKSIVWGEGDGSFQIYGRSGYAHFKYVKVTGTLGNATGRWWVLGSMYDPGNYVDE